MVLADKREIHSTIRRIEKVKTWQLVILLLMFSFIAATFLRLNNVGMVERRDAVMAADKAGDNQIIEQRLYDLQRYVSAHMNTDPGKIPLEYSYKRAYDQAFNDFQQNIASQSNNDTVAKIREYCDAQAQQGGWGRFTVTADPRYVSCINEQWDSYPAASQVDYTFTAPSTAPYYHTFLSPTWSPDFPGWTLVICGLILLVIIIRLATLGILKLILKYQYRRI